MHIPDGYLSPETCAVAYAVAVPVLAVAAKKVGASVKTRNLPTLAMLACVSFLIMMFNIPIPGGTSAHAVGAAAIAIIMGPWAAVIAVSVALLFQALVFGDGGVLALGANAVNMAILMPFVSLAVYRLVAAGSALDSRRRLVAAALAGYAGINAAGLATGFELGIQPMLFHTADGTPLYSPYTLAQAIPAMALAHLTLAGFAEAILTVALFAYLAKTDPTLLGSRPTRPARAGLTPARLAWLTVGVLALASPIGLLAPGTAFGEDAPDELDLASLGLQAVPDGLARFFGLWRHALLPDYGLPDGSHAVLAYWLSAAVGIALVGGAVYLLGRLIARLSPAPQATPAA